MEYWGEVIRYKNRVSVYQDISMQDTSVAESQAKKAF